MAHVRLAPAVILAVISMAGCSETKAPVTTTARKVTSAPWGKTPAGEAVELYTLTNAKGAEVTIATYGGRLVSLKVPDRTGKMGDVLLGFDNLDGYFSATPSPNFGALIGRYGNRIAKGKF